MLALIFITVFGYQICNGEQQIESEYIPVPDNYVSQEEALPAKGLLAAQKVNDAQETIAANWPLGVVPYYFDTSSYDHMIGARFREALDDVESSSCVKFKALLVKPTEAGIWIHVTNPNKERSCQHNPQFKLTGEIVLTLGLDCLKRRDVLHTLLHAIGFKDEVCHPERDQYIRILWNNIQPEYRRLYRIEIEAETLTEYDPISIMQFHDRAFSINGQATIAPLMSGLVINPSNGLSPLDKMKLRLLFGRECNRRKVGDLLDTCKIVLHKGLSDNKPEATGENIEADTEGTPESELEKEVSNKDSENDSNQSTDPPSGAGAPNTLIENKNPPSDEQIHHSDVVQILE